LVQILEAIAEEGGKGQYPKSLPRCGSGSDLDYVNDMSYYII
jgi:hypothetical protein